MNDLKEMPPFKVGQWGWYAGEDPELFTLGPEDTREAIIKVATDDRLGEHECEPSEWKLSFTIAHCKKRYIDIAGFFEISDFLERVDDRLVDSISPEHDESSPLEAIKDEDAQELHILVRNTIREWQKRHGYEMAVNTFEHVLDEQYIITDHPDDA